MKHVSKRTLSRRLAALYGKMAQAYAQAAPQGFTCRDCASNCCVSYFQHHTHIEWHYLWEGLDALPAERREAYVERARDYVAKARQALDEGRTPDAMCPLNDEGGCGLYEHRMMICRLYGVPNVVLGRDGLRQFPGCPRCMDLADPAKPPVVDRTPLYRELAQLEMEFLGSRRNQTPKVDMTLAEMILAGPPR
ncbi:hypothetical protein NNJEOMEG_01085 [Fundidesulfovibrio magnetotacticus]|uniref:Uncharacterized protein n=1 Tax=Fundidesulfovibrio magnetotacticus TaxID=2730080 RepID=A0A6V8LNI9_9BACT|nr:hypothetical protein [Fundidesulfovibrio magnetotacticus]GFK93254.1 hypothetical protein NNJEOMEG_01085 [Fundidesulfovibrio magnetotacticus]